MLEAIVLALVVSLAGPWLGAPWLRLDQPATVEGASAFSCTLVIGFSVTEQWFENADIGPSNFESIVGSDTWELLWQGGGAARYWASPDYLGWTNALTSPCTQNATMPDRLLLDITRDEYVTDPQIIVADITGEIATARQKYPSVRQIILQPIIGGPSHQICPEPGAEQNAVRASYNHAAIDAAIDAVVGGDVIRGADPLVGSCADYRDDMGHLTVDGEIAAGRFLGNFYLQFDGSASPPPPMATPTLAPRATPTPAPTATATPRPFPTLTPTAAPTTAPGQGSGGSTSTISTTVTFDDLPGQDRVFTGQYPAGLIDWGAGGRWWLSAPWRGLATKSVSFNGGWGPATESFAFLAPATLTSLEAFNGGPAPSTVGLACDGQAPVAQSVPPGQTVTVTTGWTGSCGEVRVSSSNGWDTNFDNLVVTLVSPSPGPAAAIQRRSVGTLTDAGSTPPTATIPVAPAAPAATATVTAPTATATATATPAATATATAPSPTRTPDPSAGTPAPPVLATPTAVAGI